MGVSKKVKTGALRYAAPDLVACVLVQQRIQKIASGRSLLFPKGVPHEMLAKWGGVPPATLSAYLKDHRSTSHKCPPPLYARVLELEYERRML